MILYTFIYLINSIGLLGNKKDAKNINYIILILLIFISGTRYYMGGSDVFIYEHIYDGTPKIFTVLKYIFSGINEGININYEIGFIFLCSVFRTLYFSYFGFQLVWIIFFYTIVYWGLKSIVDKWAAFWCVFMYKLMFYNTFISIRQGMTIALFCCMLQFIRDRSWKKYYLFAIMAFLIHRGAILLFPVYFIQFLPTNRKFIFWYSCIFLPTWLIRKQVTFVGDIILSIIGLIGYEKKSEGWSVMSQEINGLHLLECYIIILLLIIFYKYLFKNSEIQKNVILMIQLILLLVPIFTIFSNWIVFTREKDYFVLAYGIFFSILLSTNDLDVNIKEIYKKYKFISYNVNKIVSLCLLLACYIGMFRFVYRFDGGALMKFTSFLTKSSVSFFTY